MKNRLIEKRKAIIFIIFMIINIIASSVTFVAGYVLHNYKLSVISFIIGNVIVSIYIAIAIAKIIKINELNKVEI